MNAREKIRSAREITALCDALREEPGVRIIFTNGCFDLMHVGHVRYLEEARRLGDWLIVGVNTDASVRQIKGSQRPIVAEGERCEVVAALHCVDYVVPFDTPDPLPLIRMVRPHVLVKGADWLPDRIVGADEVRAQGGTVARIAFTPGMSTTVLIERIVERFAGKGVAPRDLSERKERGYIGSQEG
jgi:rfaE bifunctional protein nucleotidyltransferase chain/domain